MTPAPARPRSRRLSLPVLTLLAGLCGLGLAAPARAVPATVSAADPRQVLAFVKGFGTARLDTDRDGDPHIRGRLGRHDYQVFFYGCRRNADCREIQLIAIWPEKHPSLGRVNRWNFEKRMARAYLNPEGGLTVDVSVAMDGGIPRAALLNAFEGFRNALEQMEDWPDTATPGDDEPLPGPDADPRDSDADDASKPNDVI